jgi:hypothetical protein
LDKVQAFEPPRGSGAQVSLVVSAVHNDGLILSQPGRTLLIQLSQRDADGSGQMKLLVPLGRQDLDQWGAVFNEVFDLFFTNLSRHHIPPKKRSCISFVKR